MLLDAIAIIEGLPQPIVGEQKPPGDIPDNMPKSMEFQLRSIDIVMLDAFAKFVVQSARNMGGMAKNPTSMPRDIERWTVLSSPFVHKTSRTQFERRTHEKLVQCYGLSEELIGRLLWYVRSHSPPDIQVLAKSYSYASVSEFFTTKNDSQ